MRWRVIAVSLVCFASIWLLHQFVPPQHNPFRPPDLNEPLGLATYSKLTHLKHNPIQCRAVLAAAEGLEFDLLAADEGGQRCALDETLVLKRSLTPYSAGPLRFTCHQLAALYLWERRVVRPEAERLFGEPLSQVQTYGSFSCRKIAGTNKPSEHSFANATDIYGFVLESGERIDVRSHWREDGNKGRFLKRIHDGACDLFSVTLGPDFNADHADHFHVDMGRIETCK